MRVIVAWVIALTLVLLAILMNLILTPVLDNVYTIAQPMLQNNTITADPIAKLQTWSRIITIMIAGGGVLYAILVSIRREEYEYEYYE